MSKSIIHRAADLSLKENIDAARALDDSWINRQTRVFAEKLGDTSWPMSISIDDVMRLAACIVEGGQ